MWQPKLIIFDFDGVLIDTEYATFNFYKNLLPTHGYQITEKDFVLKRGRKSKDFFKSIMGDQYDEKLAKELTKKKRDAFAAHVDQYIKIIDGAANMLKTLRQTGIPLALATQNEQILVEKVIEKYKLDHFFKVRRTRQDIANLKPHPEIFLQVAEACNVAPTDAVVIEDSIDGIKAAKAGGFKVVTAAVTDAPVTREPSHLIIHHLSELTPKLLQKIETDELS